MSADSPASILFDSDGNLLSTKDGYSFGINNSALLLAAKNSSTVKVLNADSSGNLTIAGLGTAGTPTGGVVTIQGVSGGQAIPISGSVTANNASVSTTGSTTPSSATLIGGAVTTSAPTYSNGNLGGLSLTTGGQLRVDGSAVTQPVSGTVSANQSGTWTVQPGNTANTTPWLTTISQGGNSATVTASSALKVDGSAVTQPVSGTITANAGSGNFSVNLAQIAGVTTATGNGVVGTGVQRVAIASDNTAFSVNAVQSGTWNITNVSGTVSLPTGAATSANQSTQITSLQLIDDAVHATNAALGKSFAIAGQLDDTSVTVATEDGVAPVRITAQRGLHSNIRNSSGVELGTISNPFIVDVSGSTNQPVVGPTASGSPVSTDPVLIAGSDGTNVTTVSTKTDGSIIVSDRRIATFTAVASATILGNNKSMISLVNASGSSVVAKIHEIYLTNVQTASNTGIVTTFEMRRITNHSGGTAITAIETMETSDSLSGSVTARTGSTVTSESASLIWKSVWSSDDWGTGTLDHEAEAHTFQTMFPIYNRKTNDTKPITLRANEGFTLKCAANTNAGTFDIIIVFTQE